MSVEVSRLVRWVPMLARDLASPWYPSVRQETPLPPADKTISCLRAALEQTVMTRPHGKGRWEIARGEPPTDRIRRPGVPDVLASSRINPACG